jgi:hypothetical protein
MYLPKWFRDMGCRLGFHTWNSWDQDEDTGYVHLRECSNCFNLQARTPHSKKWETRIQPFVWNRLPALELTTEWYVAGIATLTFFIMFLVAYAIVAEPVANWTNRYETLQLFWMLKSIAMHVLSIALPWTCFRAAYDAETDYSWMAHNAIGALFVLLSMPIWINTVVTGLGGSSSMYPWEIASAMRADEYVDVWYMYQTTIGVALYYVLALLLLVFLYVIFAVTMIIIGWALFVHLCWNLSRVTKKYTALYLRH